MVLLWRHYGAKPPQHAMELHQMVDKVYTNSIYRSDTDHITLNRQTWLSA
jgi:hypothetical protein